MIYPENTNTAVLLFPDGSKFPLNLLSANLGEDYIVDIRELKNKSGIVTFDPGFSSTALCHSSVTFIDGDKGLCLYRGYPVHEIAFNHDFMTIAYLLLYGTWPEKHLKDTFEKEVKSEMPVHENIKKFFQGFMPNSHPMAMISSIVSSLAGLYLNPMEIEINAQYEKERACLRIIGKIVTIAAMAYKYTIGEPFVYPKQELSYAENLLYMMFASPSKPYTINKLHAQIINTFLNIHADHEQAASTCSLRTVGSSGANPYSCVASAISSLWGRAHGGANEAVLKMLNEIGTVENIPDFIEQVKQKKRRLMGFGHRIYKSYDPRCILMRKLCQKLVDETDNSDPLFALAMELEKIALSDPYFTSRKLYPNVDFYSGISLRSLGIPNSMMTVLFAIGRTVGWVSHWKEMIQDLPIKIARPRQIYTGSTRLQPSTLDEHYQNGTYVTTSPENSKERILSLLEAHKSTPPPVVFDYEFEIWGEHSYDFANSS